MFTSQITLLGNGMMEPIKPLTLTLSCIANISPQLDYPVHLVSNPMPVTSITQGVHVPFNGNIHTSWCSTSIFRNAHARATSGTRYELLEFRKSNITVTNVIPAKWFSI